MSYLLGLMACENDLAEVQKIIDRDETGREVAYDVELLYSDSAVMRVSIKAPVMYRYLDNNNPRAEFPNGVQVDFFNDAGKREGFLTSKYALRLDDRQQIIVRDSVVWQNRRKEMLESEELIWDERSRKVSTKKFVKITRPDEIIYGYGLMADQDFTSSRIEAVQGRIKVDKIKEE
ncbi:MAG: LPS export ABC transporter periplasmic protein LptC [Bacteroidota bacterium]